MSSKNESNGVKVLIAVITVIGTLGAAAFANWENLFPDKVSSSSENPELISSDIAELEEPADSKDTQSLDTSDTGLPEGDMGRQLETESFIVTLQDCKRDVSNIRCNFLIESKEDMWLALRPSRAIDVSGDEYESSLITFGSEENSVGVNKQLLEGVPIKASLKFDNFSEEISQLAILQVVYSFQLGAEWTGMPYATEFVRLSDVSISR
ncbi:MAG: hypothetical protein AAFQ95_22705 [Cyanobacteria bacterium J06621_3]